MTVIRLPLSVMDHQGDNAGTFHDHIRSMPVTISYVLERVCWQSLTSRGSEESGGAGVAQHPADYLGIGNVKVVVAHGSPPVHVLDLHPTPGWPRDQSHFLWGGRGGGGGI